MFCWDGFFAGVGSVLTFGLPKKQPYPIDSIQRVIENDWKRISEDLNVAMKKYQSEEKNGNS